MVFLLLAFVLTSTIIYATGRLVHTVSLDSRAIVIGLTAPVDNLSPAAIGSHEERLVGSMMYETLVQYDEAGKRIKPLLASDWKYEGNGERIVLRLNEAYFHNGKKISSADVKACWEKTLLASQEPNNISLFLPIEGSVDLLEGRCDEITGLRTSNDKTLQINLKDPNAAFIFMLTNPVFWIYDSQDIEKPASGSGPFIMQQNTGERLSLLQNEKYHRGRPGLKAIEVRIFTDYAQALAEFKGGHLDYLDKVSPQDLPDVRNDGVFSQMLLQRPLFTLYGLGFNMDKSPYRDDYLLRRALNYAVDRQVINKDILGGAYVPLKGVLPAQMPGHNKDISGYGYDVNKARQLLEQAGYPDGKGLAPLTLVYNRGQGHEQVAETVADQMAEIGIAVQPMPLDWNYYKKQMADYNLAFFKIEWSADYPDADGFLYSLFHSSSIGSGNYCAYNNNQVDRVLDASRTTLGDTSKRVKLLQKAEQMIIDDAPCIWLFQTATAKLVQGNVKNLKVDGMDNIDWYKVELKKPAIGEMTGIPSDGKV